jgi:hypothetical protein
MHQASTLPNTVPAYGLTAGPLIIKYDFKNKYPVKGFALTCDQRTMIFNVSRSLITLDVKDIFKQSGGEKIKQGWS